MNIYKRHPRPWKWEEIRTERHYVVTNSTAKKLDTSWSDFRILDADGHIVGWRDNIELGFLWKYLVDAINASALTRHEDGSTTAADDWKGAR